MLRTISAKSFAALDAHLMSQEGGYTLDQLMELAGLSVSQALYALYPPGSSSPASTTAQNHPAAGPRVLVACGPGNNGGDGLVAARHLHSYGYRPTIWYPKAGKTEHLSRLVTQARNMCIPIAPRDSRLSDLLQETDLAVDAIFGASFASGGAIREPFPEAIQGLAGTRVPVLAVDAPSGWDIETGPPEDHGHPASGYMPDALISLTAPKPLVKRFTGRHFVGGRFLTTQVADKFGIDVPAYKSVEQIVEVPVGAVRF